jgi:hypothetical protein
MVTGMLSPFELPVGVMIPYIPLFGEKAEPVGDIGAVATPVFL